MNINFNLPKELFYFGKADHELKMNIPNPQIKKWSKRNEIGYMVKGVYVIFDKMGGDEWETPNTNNLKSDIRRCIYVGEGKILNRLNKHSYNLIGQYAGEFIYYEVDNIADRKLLERILIKHFIPIFNKEGQYEYKIKKEYMDDIKTLENRLMEEINEMQAEVGLEKSGERIIKELFDNEDMTLSEIENALWEIFIGLDKEVNMNYQEIINRQ